MVVERFRARVKITTSAIEPMAVISRLLPYVREVLQANNIDFRFFESSIRIGSYDSEFGSLSARWRTPNRMQQKNP